MSDAGPQSEHSGPASEADATLRAAGQAVPKAVVNRLSLYLRELQQWVRRGHHQISSGQLGRALGVTDAQVRKDLAHFGNFGYPGVGYRCEELIQAIRRILGTDQRWAVAIVGIGNLGRALLGYRGFEQQGFHFAAAFDTDREKVGLTIDGVRVYHTDRLSEVVLERNIKLGLMAVPAPAAQPVADMLVAAGIEGILNFAPVTIVLPEQVSLIGVDLAIQLEQLAFAVARQKAESPRADG